MVNFVNVSHILQSLAIDPSTAAEPVKRMFIFDGEHITVNIATGGETGSALHTQLAHDEIIIVLEKTCGCGPTAVRSSVIVNIH